MLHSLFFISNLKYSPTAPKLIILYLLGTCGSIRFWHRNCNNRKTFWKEVIKMPFGDGTGPMGMGPMTGRAAGYCAGYPVPGVANPIPGFGRGFYPYGYPGYGTGYPGYGAGYPGYGAGYPGYGAGYPGYGAPYAPLWFGRGFGRGRGGRGRWFRGWW
jgi:hypothetical protein